MLGSSNSSESPYENVTKPAAGSKTTIQSVTCFTGPPSGEVRMMHDNIGCLTSNRKYFFPQGRLFPRSARSGRQLCPSGSDLLALYSEKSTCN